MIEIALEGLEFYAYHGFYKQEQEIGNKYSIDLKVLHESSLTTEDLKTTVDYEILYKIVKDEMGKKFKLLETISNNILTRIFIHFPFISFAEVSVSKFNPPLGGICAKAKVTMKRNK